MSDEENAPDALGSAASELVLYAAPSGSVSVRVLVQDETVWLPQRQIAELSPWACQPSTNTLRTSLMPAS